MRSPLDDLSVPNDQDLVRLADRAEPMGNDEARSTLHQSSHRLLNMKLRSRVHVARRLVEDEDRRIGQHRAGDREQLPLPLAQVASFGVQIRVVAVGQLADERVGVREPGRLFHFPIVGFQTAIPYVVSYRPGEDVGILQHKSDFSSDRLLVKLPDILSVDQDPARLNIVKPGQQVDNRRLARARRSDEGDRPARLRMQRYVLEHDRIRIVAEVHPVEHDFAPDGEIRHVRGNLRNLRLQIEHFEYALGSGDGGLEQIVLVGELVDRLAELAGIVEEADDDADCNHVMIGEDAAKNRNDEKRQVARRVHDRPHRSREALSLHADRTQPLVDLAESFDRLSFSSERLHDFQAGDALLHEAVHFPKLLLLLREVPAGIGGDLLRDEHHERNRQHRNERHPDAQAEHHRQAAHKRQDAGDQLDDGLIQRVGDVGNIVDRPAHQLAVRPSVEERNRQALVLLEQILPHIPNGVLGQARGHVLLNPGEERSQHVNPEQDQAHAHHSVVSARNDIVVEYFADQIGTEQREARRQNRAEDDPEQCLPLKL